MTWNIHTFPKTANTIGHVSKILRDRPLDLVAVEEIDSAVKLDEADSSYLTDVSDHRPVLVRLRPTP
jgi:endonuclease/exonuclease/phosphatase (EEP) superfamily protein YafD